MHTPRRALRPLSGVLLGVAGAALAVGCTPAAPPAPAVMRTDPAPWPAPRDAVSYIDAAGLQRVRLDATDHQHVITMRILTDGRPVPLASDIGIDKVRAVQAPVHTHEADGTVWLEGEGTDQVTLGSFFTVWGVRMDEHCLGATCGTLTVIADGRQVPNPRDLRLDGVSDVEVRVAS